MRRPGALWHVACWWADSSFDLLSKLCRSVLPLLALPFFPGGRRLVAQGIRINHDPVQDWSCMAVESCSGRCGGSGGYNGNCMALGSCGGNC
eukprot:7839726-Pyramimonas_sp.AAC.1